MSSASTSQVCVIGAGPAGLMAAEMLAGAGHAVTVFERMPSPARKFLLAGRGGLNLTHSEPLTALLARYGDARARLEPAISAFPPAAVTAWCEALGEATFVGSSGRIFPRALKTAPLLRAWLRRLDAIGVRLRTRHTWRGWTDDGALRFTTQDGERSVAADATVLALGGASWPRLGADGGWVDFLPGVEIVPLRPANCGFTVAWSDIFRTRHAGSPLKRIALTFGGTRVRGEAMITAAGIEGGAVYALAAPLRDALAAGPVGVELDMCPDLTADEVARRLALPRRGQSLANFLRKAVGLDSVRVGLIQEALHGGGGADLGTLIKAHRLRLEAPTGIARAISTAGGIAWPEVNADFMLHRRPGVFVAGEMLDWEAPTGGYLLQACLATGRAAGAGAVRFLAARGRAGMLVLVVGPSGAGKDTLLAAARRLLAGDTRFRFVRREITRPADAGGEDHVAVDAATFAVRRAAGSYALAWEAHGLGYGIPADIAADIAAGKVVVANVSRGVIAEAALNYPVLVLEITAPAEVLAERLAARGREDTQDVARRLARRVDLPAGVAVERVVNDGSLAAGAAQLVGALNRAAECAGREQTPPSPPPG